MQMQRKEGPVLGYQLKEQYPLSSFDWRVGGILNRNLNRSHRWCRAQVVGEGAKYHNHTKHSNVAFQRRQST